MDRLTNKLLFFGIAFGIVGALWGAFLAEPYSKYNTIFGFNLGQPMITQWFPIIALLIFLFTVFFSSKLIKNDFRKSITITAIFCIAVNFAIPFNLMLISYASEFFVNIISCSILVAASILVLCFYAILDFKNKKNEKKEEQINLDYKYIKKKILLNLKAASILLIYYVLYKSIINFETGNEWYFFDFTPVWGLFIFLINYNVASIEFARICFVNIASGALVGMILPLIVTNRRGMSTTEIYWEYSPLLQLLKSPYL